MCCAGFRTLTQPTARGDRTRAEALEEGPKSLVVQLLIVSWVSCWTLLTMQGNIKALTHYHWWPD